MGLRYAADMRSWLELRFWTIADDHQPQIDDLHGRAPIRMLIDRFVHCVESLGHSLKPTGSNIIGGEWRLDFIGLAQVTHVCRIDEPRRALIALFFTQPALRVRLQKLEGRLDRQHPSGADIQVDGFYEVALHVGDKPTKRRQNAGRRRDYYV